MSNQDDTTLPEFARQQWPEPPEPEASPPSRPEPEEGDQIEDVILDTHKGVTALQALLEPPEEGESKIEEVVGLLEQIVLGQRHLQMAVDDLHAKVDALGARGMRRVSLAASTGTDEGSTS